jgi:hypothetical protein
MSLLGFRNFGLINFISFHDSVYLATAMALLRRKSAMTVASGTRQLTPFNLE